MPNPQSLKKRLKSVKNIAKITKSMQLVAVSKVQKYQAITYHVNQYMDELLSLLHTLQIGEIPKRFTHHFQYSIQNPKTDSQLLVLLAPTRGFTGILIANYIHTLRRFLNSSSRKETVIIGLHKKATDIANSLNTSIQFQYPKELTHITPENIEDFFNYIMLIRKQSNINTTYICYPRFKNIFTYEIRVEQYLPIPTLLTNNDNSRSDYYDQSVRKLQSFTPNTQTEYLLEPDKEKVIQKILELYLEGYLTYAVANLNASEFSARMIAMKNANDNAIELQHSLMQEFNKVRQTNITNMISDIIRANI